MQKEITDQFITKIVNDEEIEMVCISENKFYLTKAKRDLDFHMVEISRSEFLQWIAEDF
jgi:hypothetical protein